MEYLIGVLAVLVTALIGWQIFALIDIEKVRAEIKQNRLELVEQGLDISIQANRASYIASMDMADFFYTQLHKEEKVINLQFKYIHHRLLAVMHASEIGMFTGCDAQINMLLESFNLQNIRLIEKQKDVLIEALLSIKNTKNINGYTRLFEFVSSIKAM